MYHSKQGYTTMVQVVIILFSTFSTGLCFYGSKAFHSFTMKYFSSINSTIGHSDSLSSFGIQQSNKPNNLSELPDHFEKNDSENNRIIKLDELTIALKDAIYISTLTNQEIKQRGWNEVCMNENFSLYKRRIKSESSPVEYLMIGEFYDVSPRVFLYSQIDKACRLIWDKTMGDMSDGKITIHKCNIQQNFYKPETATTACVEEDVLYYRTRWPWPLKDRDYVLARRCKIFDESNSIVLVSKSIETDDFNDKSGAIRVDNYWCKSVFISTRKSYENDAKNSANIYDTKLMKNVADTVVPLISYRKSHLLSYQRSHPKYKIKLNMLSNLKRKKALSELIPPTSLYFLRGYTSNSCNSMENINFIPTQITQTKIKKLRMNSGGMQNNEISSSLSKLTNDSKTLKTVPCITSAPSQIMPGNNNLDSSNLKKKIDLPGMKFVTIFCDDQKVPLPNTVTDILSKQGEKVVPGSIDRLHEVARDLELKGLP